MRALYRRARCGQEVEETYSVSLGIGLTRYPSRVVEFTLMRLKSRRALLVCRGILLGVVEFSLMRLKSLTFSSFSHRVTFSHPSRITH